MAKRRGIEQKRDFIEIIDIDNAIPLILAWPVRLPKYWIFDAEDEVDLRRRYDMKTEWDEPFGKWHDILKAYRLIRKYEFENDVPKYIRALKLNMGDKSAATQANSVVRLANLAGGTRLGEGDFWYAMLQAATILVEQGINPGFALFEDPPPLIKHTLRIFEYAELGLKIVQRRAVSLAIAMRCAFEVARGIVSLFDHLEIRWGELRGAETMRLARQNEVGDPDERRAIILAEYDRLMKQPRMKKGRAQQQAAKLAGLSSTNGARQVRTYLNQRKKLLEAF